jgi:uncharacterized protein YciI
MKYVVQYVAPDELDMDAIMENFPAHQVRWKEYADAGTLLAIGPMADPSEGAMGIFTTREAAESFVAGDPFVLKGLMASYRILEWREVLLQPLDPA